MSIICDAVFDAHLGAVRYPACQQEGRKYERHQVARQCRELSHTKSLYHHDVSRQNRPNNQQNTSQIRQMTTARARNVSILRRRAATNKRAAPSSM